MVNPTILRGCPRRARARACPTLPEAAPCHMRRRACVSCGLRAMANRNTAQYTSNARSGCCTTPAGAVNGKRETPNGPHVRLGERSAAQSRSVWHEPGRWREARYDLKFTTRSLIPCESVKSGPRGQGAAHALLAPLFVQSGASIHAGASIHRGFLPIRPSCPPTSRPKRRARRRRTTT